MMQRILLMTQRLLFLPILFVFTHNSFSQIIFEKGYFIDNSGVRSEILIKNIDWKNSPTEFQYKLSENDEPKIATTESVKEFGISNNFKYQSVLVKIDRSSKNLAELSRSRVAQFEEERLFLKVLIEGKATLYQYQDGNLSRYFYKVDTAPVDQLVYKLYLAAENKVGENSRYRQQLSNSLQCSNLSARNFKNVRYTKKSLVDLFVRYNSCYNMAYKNYEEMVKRDLFNLTFRPGVSRSSLSIQRNSFTSASEDFGSNINFRWGLEMEFILPFNKNKWAIILEPTYQYFKVEKGTANVDYESVEFPLGLRHYFFLNNNLKVFVNASYVLDFTKDSRMKIDKSELEIVTRQNLAVGAGLKAMDRFSVEMRYGLSRELLSEYIFYSSNYRSLSIILGYSIF